MKALEFSLSLIVFAHISVASAEPIVSPEQDENEVRLFWTFDHMKEAERARGSAVLVPEVITKNGDQYGFVKVEDPSLHEDSRRAGILFYVSNDGAKQHCSATVLNSAKGNLILTAAHCVVDVNDEWKSKMMFVPAYDGSAVEDKRAPYGLWPIHHAFLPQTRAYLNEDTDIAVASAFPQAGKNLQATVGGASAACLSEGDSTLPTSQLWAYPGADYSGGEMRNCLTRIEPSTTSTGMLTPNCETMSGSSGGGLRFKEEGTDWIIGVVHSNSHAARLRSSTFLDLYKVASEADSAVDIPNCTVR